MALTVVYVGWNAVWLLLLRALPPSLLFSLTGVPAPTTGMTRSLLFLLQADFRNALLWNPMALPMALLFAACLVWLLLLAVRRRRLILPSWVLHGWFVLLALAWMGKFALGSAYW